MYSPEVLPVEADLSIINANENRRVGYLLDVRNGHEAWFHATSIRGPNTAVEGILTWIVFMSRICEWPTLVRQCSVKIVFPLSLAIIITRR